MKRKFISYYHYTDADLKKYVSEQTDNEQFRIHCKSVAEQLNISVQVVEEVLRDKSFQVLKLIQQKIIERKTFKISIFGYFSFQYTIRLYKLKKIKRS